MEALSTLLRADPVLAYSLLAAVFLAAVSLATGLARGDVVALLRPGVLLRVAAAVALALLLTVLTEALATSLGTADTPWSLEGVRRWPLYLLALAYGPSVGAVTALLFAAFESSGGLPSWAEAVLVLEMVALGWLAIYPNPRSRRTAGPFYAILAYALAWGTGGLALLAYRSGAVTGIGIWQQHQSEWLGLLLCALLLFAVGPRSYRALFPHSRIAPVATSQPIVQVVVTETLERRRLLHDPKLTVPDLPERYARHDRRRDLEPLPFDLDDDTG
jgi:hypothetical protein